MIEATREQNEVAEALAEQYGRCKVTMRADGSMLAEGMDTGSVVMERRLVAPNGAWQYPGGSHVVQQPVKPARYGFLVIRGTGAVVPCADMAHVGRVLLAELRDRAAAKVRVRTSLTRDRELTAAEQKQAVDAAVAAALAEGVPA